MPFGCVVPALFLVVHRTPIQARGQPQAATQLVSVAPYPLPGNVSDTALARAVDITKVFNNKVDENKNPAKLVRRVNRDKRCVLIASRPASRRTCGMVSSVGRQRPR